MDVQKLWPKVRRLEDAANKGGMGRTITRPPIVYDGTSEPVDLFGDGNTWTKVSDSFIDFNSVKCIERTDADGLLDKTVRYKYYSDDIIVLDGSDETTKQQSVGDKEGRPLAVSMDVTLEDGRKFVGVYVFDVFNETLKIYVSRIEFEETIHPIDPKFIPDTVATKADIFGAMEASY